MATREGIWIVPAGGTDQFGDPLPSGEPIWAPGAIVLPRKGRETDSGGVVVISGYEVFFKPPPRHFTLRATDAVLVRGEEHQVDGPTALYAGKALQFFTERVGV